MKCFQFKIRFFSKSYKIKNLLKICIATELGTIHKLSWKGHIDRFAMKITKEQKSTILSVKHGHKIRIRISEFVEKTSKHSVTALMGGKATGNYRFKRGFWSLVEMPQVSQKMLDEILKNKITAW